MLVNTNYQEQIAFLSNQYEEINGYDFYKYIYPNNEYSGIMNTDYSTPNAIYLYKDEKDENTKRRLRRRIMLKDTWEDDYINYIERNPLTLCSGLAYRGRANNLNNAQKMNALIFDLDGVGQEQIANLFNRLGANSEFLFSLPLPTFVVCSGSGLHIYYVFDEPVDLFPNIKSQLKKLKYRLTPIIWDYTITSQESKVQYQSINQAFRMVGSLNQKYGTEVRAFKIGEKLRLEDLNKYVPEEFRVDITKRFKPSTMTREQAKEKYPGWYEKVVIQGNKKSEKWDIRSKQGFALYNWWKNQIDKIHGGHRYFFLFCLAVYAQKCDVPKEHLYKDMKEIFEYLKRIKHSNAFTEYDLESAMKAYDENIFYLPIKDIESLSGIRIERNRRNYRTQADHLKRNRIVQQALNPNWRNTKGRPNYEKEVKEFIKNNPTFTPTQIAKELGISRPTVYKYL